MSAMRAVQADDKADTASRIRVAIGKRSDHRPHEHQIKDHWQPWEAVGSKLDLTQITAQWGKAVRALVLERAPALFRIPPQHQALPQQLD